MKSTTHLCAALLGAVFFLPGVTRAAATFIPNDQPTGWVAEMEVSNLVLNDGSQTAYRTQYQRATWLGDVIAFPITAGGRVDYANPRWSPSLAAKVTAQNWDTGRRIGTMKADGSKIPLRWASLAASQQSLLTSAAAPAGANLVAFLRGDRTNESPAGGYRNRGASTLGDIVHSRPAYVKYATGEQRLFVGANDGMLHAFDAASTGTTAGTEVFAYVPSMLMGAIGNLKANPYTHQYLVDASPNIRDVKLSGADKKVLVSGLGAGGRGVFALDITSPSAATDQAAADKVLWEITPTTVNNATDATYADLGYTYGIPLIFKANTGNWVAVIANGYNSATGAAVLYVVNLSTGALIRKIDTGATGTLSNPNGLSSPAAVDLDQNGTADYVYAGDINGNLWKFDLTSTNPASWGASKLVATSPARAITGAPGVSLHPLGGFMVIAGTGRMFTAADAADTGTDYVYGIWDKPSVSGSVSLSQLVDQSLTAKTYTSGAISTSVRVSSSNAVDYSSKRGWRLALPPGERLVGDGGFTINGRYAFTGTNPTVTNPAPQTAGLNWQNELDHLTGGGGDAPSFDLNGDGLLTDGDRVFANNGVDRQAGSTGIPVSRFLGQGLFSQPIIAQLTSLNIALYNTNPDLPPPILVPTVGGVANGHFDFDIYYGGCTPGVNAYKSTCNVSDHVHEYDDKYNVTGVNMLAPSLLAFDLANAIPSGATRFKVLIANQKLSPAVYLGLGSGVPQNVRNVNTASSLALSALPSYSRSDVTKFYFTMPVDAFASKDWAGDGVIRAGLVPTQTGCVHDGTGAITKAGASPLKVTGFWMNGALTIQVIKDTTPDSAIELNINGDPSMGYRLKIDGTSQSYQLAQYTVFWHHPNGKCITDSGWVMNPPQDSSGSASSVTPDNPKACDPLSFVRTCTPGAPLSPYNIEGSKTVAAASNGGPPPAVGTTTTTTYFGDGSAVTTTVTVAADGTVTVSSTSTVPSAGAYSGSGPCPGPTCGCPGANCNCPGPNCPCQGPQCTEAAEKIKAGRLSWRQLIKQ